MLLLRGAPYFKFHPFLLFLSLRRLSSSSADAAAAEAWVAKAVATAFLLSPPSSAAARLAPLRGILTPFIALEALRRLPGPHPALSFFELTRSKLHLDHLPAAHCYLFSLLLDSGRRESALKLFDEMMQRGGSLDAPFLEFFIKSLIESGDVDSAMVLLDRAAELKCQVRSYTYNNLLGSLVVRGRVLDAVGFFEKHLGSAFLTVDTCTFNVVMKGLCSVGEIDRCFELFRGMREFECLPDTITHNILIDGLCRNNHVERGRDMLRRLQLDDSCVPNVVTYTSVISGYCKVGKMEEALAVFNEMIGYGIKPSRVSYNVLIDGYGKDGDMPSAIATYERMMACGCPPDVITFSSLIDGYCRGGQIDDALKLWHVMGGRNLQPNVYTFAIVINALCKKNRLSEARVLLNELNRRKDIMPRAFIYNPVIDGFCKSGNVDEANLILTEMQERRCFPDKFTYTILIIGHCMKGRMVEAIALFNKMVTTGCAPDSITVSSFISCLLKAGMPNEAIRIVLMASGKGLGFDDLSSNNLSFPLRKNTEISVAV